MDPRDLPFYRDETRPFAQRADGMSLDIIRPKDIPKGKTPYVKDELASLQTQDIRGARPTYKHLNYLEKPDFSVGNTDPDHAGGRANTYYPPMDRRPRDLSLTTADIEYAQPKTVKWRGNRHTDPVCPQYELPSSYRREPTPPRFNGRHTNDIRDIEHSSSKVLHPEKSYTRNPNDATDIEYASANYHERLKRQTARPRDDLQLNVRDITDNKPTRQRCTNPLEPTYRVASNSTTSLHARFAEERGMELPKAEPIDMGEVPGSKARKLHWDNGEPQLSLVREDIPGTVPQRFIGCVPANIYDPPEVRPPISFHDPNDIAGAQVGSLKKGIATGRQCNPLNPRYPMLDGSMQPHSQPVFEAERGGMSRLHPMCPSRGGTASLPDLHGRRNPGMQTPAGARTPAGSRTPSGPSRMGSARFDPAPQHYQTADSTSRLPAYGEEAPTPMGSSRPSPLQHQYSEPGFQPMRAPSSRASPMHYQAQGAY